MEAIYTIRLEDRFTNPLGRMEGRMNKFEKNVGGLNLSVGRLAAGLGLAFGGAQVIGGIKKMSRLAAEFEQTSIAFETMLGSQKAAKSMIDDITDFANKTPFTRGQIADNAKLLLNFGVSSKKVLPNLKMLGDVSGGNAERFKSLSLAFAQVQASGRLMGQDLLQMINAGFNPLQTISEKTGVSMGNLKKMMEKGAISAKDVENAFLSATSAGGKFFNMMDKQSTTFEGRMSTLADKWEGVAISMGQSINTFLGPALDKAIEKLDEMMDRQGKMVNDAEKQMNAFKGLNSSIIPLIEQYDKLKNRWDLSPAEHKKMMALQSQIGNAIPSAATVGSRGNITGINTKDARSFIRQQGEAFMLQNRSAESEVQKRLKEVETQTAQVQLALRANQLGKAKFDASSGLAALNDLQQERLSLQNRLSKLRGDRVRAFIRDEQSTGDKSAGLFSGIKSQADKDKEVGVEKISSGTRNITLNITQLVGEVTIERPLGNVGDAELTERIKRILLTAVNDVNYVAS